MVSGLFLYKGLWFQGRRGLEHFNVEVSAEGSNGKPFLLSFRTSVARSGIQRVKWTPHQVRGDSESVICSVKIQRVY